MPRTTPAATTSGQLAKAKAGAATAAGPRAATVASASAAPKPSAAPGASTAASSSAAPAARSITEALLGQGVPRSRSSSPAPAPPSERARSRSRGGHGRSGTPEGRPPMRSGHGRSDTPEGRPPMRRPRSQTPRGRRPRSSTPQGAPHPGGLPGPAPRVVAIAADSATVEWQVHALPEAVPRWREPDARDAVGVYLHNVLRGAMEAPATVGVLLVTWGERNSRQELANVQHLLGVDKSATVDVRALSDHAPLNALKRCLGMNGIVQARISTHRDFRRLMKEVRRQVAMRVMAHLGELATATPSASAAAATVAAPVALVTGGSADAATVAAPPDVVVRVGIFCNHGKHRSVAVAELAAWCLSRMGTRVAVLHESAAYQSSTCGCGRTAGLCRAQVQLAGTDEAGRLREDAENGFRVALRNAWAAWCEP